jgi:hypothetical protein
MTRAGFSRLTAGLARRIQVNYNLDHQLYLSSFIFTTFYDFASLSIALLLARLYILQTSVLSELASTVPSRQLANSPHLVLVPPQKLLRTPSYHGHERCASALEEAQDRGDDQWR